MMMLPLGSCINCIPQELQAMACTWTFLWLSTSHVAGRDMPSPTSQLCILYSCSTRCISLSSSLVRGRVLLTDTPPVFFFLKYILGGDLKQGSSQPGPQHTVHNCSLQNKNLGARHARKSVCTLCQTGCQPND